MRHLARGQRVELSAADQVGGMAQAVDSRIGWKNAVASRRAVDVLVQDAGL